MTIEKVGDTYQFKLRNNDSVVIGDPESEGTPALTLNRWGNECYLKLQSNEKMKRIVGDNSIKWQSSDYDFKLYPVDTRESEFEGLTFKQNELGGLELEIILKKKPRDNSFVFPIETKGLVFYYQPPLTQEYRPDDCEIYTETHIKTKSGEECFRLPEVVGSYAVYHATKGNTHPKSEAEKYKVGKAFHIYRPKITDAKGNTEWCDLRIDEKKGNLIITVPEEFLNTATYPATIDPNFGYETAGKSQQTVKDRISGSWFTCPEAGTADSMTAYITMIVGPTVPPPTQSVKYALYKKSDNSFVDNTEEYSTANLLPSWKTLDFKTPPSLQNIDYWLVAWGGSTGQGDVLLYYDTGTNGGYQNRTYNSFPDPWSPTTENKKYSIYCTYTPAAVPATYLKPQKYW